MSELRIELQALELLESADFSRLGEALSTLLDCPVAMSDKKGVMVWGLVGAAALRQPLLVEQEIIGYLLADTDETKLSAAADIMNSVLQARGRHLVANHVHDVEVDANHPVLQLQYQKLAEEFDQRVQAQVLAQGVQQRQIYESERFAAIGQLAAGVAHEINTPLGFMRSNLNTLSHYLKTIEQLKDQPHISAFWQEHDMDYVLRDSQELLAESSAGMERIERIVRDLRGFSCVDTPEMEFVDPGECLRRAISMINMQKSAAIELECTIAVLPPIACQMGLLSQAFLNVLRNALQAVQSGGKILITARMDGTASLITIQDNGPGMSSECLKHVFEPFFTTRPVGSGTGLGLTVARDAIEAHGGRIDIVSQPSGTTVSIRFVV